MKERPKSAPARINTRRRLPKLNRNTWLQIVSFLPFNQAYNLATAGNNFWTTRNIEHKRHINKAIEKLKKGKSINRNTVSPMVHHYLTSYYGTKLYFPSSSVKNISNENLGKLMVMLNRGRVSKNNVQKRLFG